VNAAPGHTRGTAEGHALFLNPSERETGESTNRPTKMKVTEKVRALLRSVKPAVRRYATAHGSRDFDPRGLLHDKLVSVYVVLHQIVDNPFENVFLSKIRKKVIYVSYICERSF